MRPVASCLAVLWVSLASIPAHAANLTANAGFETGSPILDEHYNVFGTWYGDAASYVSAENGIVPAEGRRTLRFRYTLPLYPAPTNSCQLWQNIDLGFFGAEIGSGQASLAVTALFNRIQFDAQTDTAFDIAVRAYDGVPESHRQLMWDERRILTDGKPETWEKAEMDNFLLPSDTKYVQLEIRAAENVFNDSADPEFDGHYADDVRATVNLRGDADRDGDVDIFDVAAVQVNFGAAGKRWAEGDFTGDGSVNIFDVTALQIHYGYPGYVGLPSSGAAPVPEPSTLALAAMGLAALAAHGRHLRRGRG